MGFGGLGGVPIGYAFAGTPILSLPFGTLPAGAFAGTLPGAITPTYACSSSGRTCRTSASSIVTGIGANVPAIEAIVTSEGATPLRGLLMEPTSKNVSPQAQLVSLFANAGSGTDSYGALIAGPDGSTNAQAVTVPSGGYSKFQNFTVAGTTFGVTFSFWAMAVSGTARVQPLYTVGGAGATVAFAAAVGASWQRVAASTAFNPGLAPGTGTLFPMSSGDDSGTTFGEAATDHGPAYMGFLQMEGYGFPTSWIAPGVTRAATTLSLPSLATFVRNGRIRFDIGLMPLGNSLSTGVFQMPYIGYSQRLWTAAGDATTYVEVDGATGKIRASVGGTTTLSDASALWSPSDFVQLYVEAGNGPTNVYMSTNGAGASLIGQSQTSLPAIPGAATAGAIALCYDPTSGLQLPAAVNYINFW